MGFLYFLEILDGFCILMQLLLSFFVMVCLDPEKTWEMTGHGNLVTG